MKNAGDEAIFAPTPPLETLRTVLSLATTQLPGQGPICTDPESEDRVQISLVDISRAYSNARIDQSIPEDQTFVDLPQNIRKQARGYVGGYCATCTALVTLPKDGRTSIRQRYSSWGSPRDWRAHVYYSTPKGSYIAQSMEIISRLQVPK